MPMKQFELQYLPLFYDDLRRIVQYILGKLNNPEAADSFINDVEDAIIKRSFCAESFEPYPSTRNRKQPYYAIYVNNYVVYYVVIKHRIMEVRRCLYKGQDRVKLI